MMSKPLSPSGSPGVFRPVMLNPVVSNAGPREHVTPHPMRIGEFYHKNVVLMTLLAPSGSGFYSRCTAWDSGFRVSLSRVYLGCPERDIKQFKGGPVRRPSPPVGWDHLANVGQEAPCRFSGYSTVL